MKIAPQITFNGSESSDAARALILSEVDRLETRHRRISGCRVTVIPPSHRHRHGTGFEIHIRFTAPPHGEIVVTHTPSDDARHEDAHLAIKDAFASARRRLDDLAA